MVHCAAICVSSLNYLAFFFFFAAEGGARVTSNLSTVESVLRRLPV